VDRTRGAHPWPARSPDLKPLDLFEVKYLSDLRVRVQSVTPEMIRNSISRSLLRRAQLYLEMNGGHFEHLF
jgi:hypothetical protein